MARVIADVNYNVGGWRNYELTKSVAVALAESAGSLGAWHDNESLLKDCDVNQIVLNPELYMHMIVLNPATGKVRLEDGTTEMHPPESEVITSRDCGLFQINLRADDVGTEEEANLRTESIDPLVWQPVMDANVQRARLMYDRAWMRDGKQDIRRWQAWVAYITGWATFPEFWVWRQDADHNPVGPWVKTGRYIQRAIAGQMNRRVMFVGDWGEKEAVYYGKRYARHFGINPDALYWDAKNGIVGWHVPPAPQAAPSDGVGPRPIPNNGV